MLNYLSLIFYLICAGIGTFVYLFLASEILCKIAKEYRNLKRIPVIKLKIKMVVIGIIILSFSWIQTLYCLGMYSFYNPIYAFLGFYTNFMIVLPTFLIYPKKINSLESLSDGLDYQALMIYKKLILNR